MDMSRAVGKVLLKDLECPVCMEYMVPPIKLCRNGHNICSKCKERVTCCPTCKAEFSEIRNVALENIVRTQKYPCDNRQGGCLDLFSIEHIAKHQGDCVYGKIKCPIHLFKKCPWNGLKNDLKEHIKAAHPTILLEKSSVNDHVLSNSFAILSYFGELFTYYKQPRGGRLYCAVQLIGTRSEATKFKCEFTLRAANGIEQISNTFLVHGYSEDWETIFNSGKCLKLDEDTLKHFVEENKLKMTVRVSRV
jgi:E3 ubiquitin-protein ligase SIAH1